MYELAKPSQLRAGPPLRNAGLPGVHMIVLGHHVPQKWPPQVGKNTRCMVSAFTHTYYGPY